MTISAPKAYMTRISVHDLTKREFLAGKSDGLRDYPLFLSAVESTAPGETIVLDWKGIEIASASYFGSTFVTLLRMAINGELDRYFILVGLNKTAMEELKLVLDLQQLVALVGDLKDGKVKNLQIVGSLDPAYAETLEALQQKAPVSATELHKHSRSKIGKTGWINRLTNLHRLRLAKKERVGREYVFEALGREKAYGR
jgi:hypothetical protein